MFLVAACVFCAIQWQTAHQELLILSLKIEEQQKEIEVLNTQSAQLEQSVDIAKFNFYYASLTKQRYGVQDLAQYLNRWEWIEGTYKANIFDCSQMAAYLDWRLENEGYHTIIVCGQDPGGSGFKHCWVLVEVEAGKYIPVEPTLYSVIFPQHPYYDNYFVYERKFETIHEALQASPQEFNWWD